MSIDSEADLSALKAVGRVVAETIERVRAHVRAGITTGELDDIASHAFREHGARSGPALDYGYSATICISVNEDAVHGIPGPRLLDPGDVVTVDVTAELDGYYADAAVTPLAPVSPQVRQLCACAKQARHGMPLQKLGRIIEVEVWRRGFRRLRDLQGHGVGRRVHEEPGVPNWADPDNRGMLTEGLVITLESIVSVSSNESRVLHDGWTIVSADGSLTAHFEPTLVIRRGAPTLLTAA